MRPRSEPVISPRRGTRGLLLALAITSVVAAVLVVSCGTSPRGAPGAPTSVDRSDLNVILVILDAAGAAHLSAYGLGRDTSPSIVGLARSGTLFQRAYSQSAWTLPSSAAFFTGLYPPRRADRRMRPTSPTIAMYLHDAGYATAAFSENAFVSEDFNFARGFDHFVDRYPWKHHDEAPDGFARADSQQTVDQAIDWIDSTKGTRFFLYVHLLPPHSPYNAPPPFAGRFDPEYRGAIQGDIFTLHEIAAGKRAIDERDLAHLRFQYEENLAFADRQVGRLLRALDERDLAAHTIVIVAADHGEAFREHGYMLHTVTLYDEMIHVPLVMRFPPRFGSLPGRWPEVVETRAILPTLCDALAIDACADRERSLLERLRNGNPDRPGSARSRTHDATRRPLAAIVAGNHKLIVGSRLGSVRLYDLARDPLEQHDIAPQNHRLVNELRRLLRAADAETMATGKPPVGDRTRQSLRALGYAD